MILAFLSGAAFGALAIVIIAIALVGGKNDN